MDYYESAEQRLKEIQKFRANGVNKSYDVEETDLIKSLKKIDGFDDDYPWWDFIYNISLNEAKVEKLNNLARKIKPIQRKFVCDPEYSCGMFCDEYAIMHGGDAFYIDFANSDNGIFTMMNDHIFPTYYIHKIPKLEKIARIYVRGSINYHGCLDISIAQILLSIPKEYLKDANCYEFAGTGVMHKSYHIAWVDLFKLAHGEKEPEIVTEYYQKKHFPTKINLEHCEESEESELLRPYGKGLLNKIYKERRKNFYDSSNPKLKEFKSRNSSQLKEDFGPIREM